jgi:hypothetical protein
VTGEFNLTYPPHQKPREAYEAASISWWKRTPLPWSEVECLNQGVHSCRGRRGDRNGSCCSRMMRPDANGNANPPTSPKEAVEAVKPLLHAVFRAAASAAA